MSTSEKLNDRIYEETDELIESMERNKGTTKQDFRNRQEFAEYFRKFIGSEEFYGGLTKADIDYLYQQDDIQKIVTENNSSERIKQIEQALLRENPELIRAPTRLYRFAETQYLRERQKEKRAVRGDTGVELRLDLGIPR